MPKTIEMSGIVTMEVETDKEIASEAINDAIRKYNDNIRYSRMPIKSIELTNININEEDFR